jgi:hypothetical protein
MDGGEPVLVDRTLVVRVETFFAATAAATARSLAALEPGGGATVAERAGGPVVYMRPGMFLNRAFALGVSMAAEPDDVDFVIDFFTERDRQARPRESEI